MFYYQSVLAVSLVIIVAGLGLGFYAFPIFIRANIRKIFTLEPETELRKAWEKTAFPLVFKVYVFNVTNPEVVENGGKPVLKEIGPFVFE